MRFSNLFTKQSVSSRLLEKDQKFQRGNFLAKIMQCKH